MSDEPQDASESEDSNQLNEVEEPSIAGVQKAKRKKAKESEIQDLDDLDDLPENDDGEAGEELSLENLDGALMEAAPELKDELKDIEGSDFSKLDIDDSASGHETTAPKKKLSLALLKNMDSQQKFLLFSILGILLFFVPLFFLTVTDRILPSFHIPYLLGYAEISNEIHNYDPGEDQVPLFDSFRTKAFTLVLPETVISFKPVEGSASFGRFIFTLNIRDKEYGEVVQKQQAAVIDLIQRTLEQVTWDDMQSPLGKEKVKKILRYRLNELFEADLVVGVYYKSIILTK